MRKNVWALVLVLASVPSRAAGYDAQSPAARANEGWTFFPAPVLLVPTDPRPLGGGLHLELRYGIPADPVIVAPGGRFAVYALAGHIVSLGVGTARVTLPLKGPIAPFVVAGFGLGGVSNEIDEGADKVTGTGAALLGGGGFVVHFGHTVGIGLEVTYQAITSTDFHAVALAPSLSFGF